MPQNAPLGTPVKNNPLKKVPLNRSVLFVAGVVILALLIPLLAFLGKKFNLNLLKALPTPIPKVAKLTLPCPTVLTFCQTLKPIKINERIVAYGAKIPPNAPLLAVFNGKAIKRGVSVVNKDKTVEKYYSYTLINDKDKIKAIYYLKDSFPIRNAFVSKEQISTVSAEVIKNMDGNNFAFVVINNENQPIPIEKIEFK